MSEEQHREDANQQISDKLAQAKQLIKECEELADRHGLTFKWDLTYGMGGSFVGRGTQAETWDESWESSDMDYLDLEDNYGWLPSSQAC